MIRIGIIGIGRMGNYHAKTVQAHPDCKLVGFFDTDESQAKAAMEIYPGTIEFTNIFEIKEQCDAVILSSPASTHYLWLKVLSKTDLHILCEKPCTDTYEQYLHVSELFKNKKNVVNIGFTERFNPTVLALKPMIKEDLPEIMTYFTRKSFTKRNCDVSCVVDTMIHDIDLAMFLFPNIGLPTNVSIKEVKHIGVTSIATALVEFKGHSILFDCSKEYAPVEPFSKAVRSINSYSGSRKVFEANLLHQSINQQFIPQPDRDSLSLQLDAFLEAISSRKHSGVSLEQAGPAMHIAGLIDNKIYKSLYGN